MNNLTKNQLSRQLLNRRKFFFNISNFIKTSGKTLNFKTTRKQMVGEVQHFTILPLQKSFLEALKPWYKIKLTFL